MASKRPRLDLGRLSNDSLQRYARKYRLPLSNHREDMVAQVNRHFSAQQFMLDDEEVLIAFIKALKSKPKSAPAAQGQPYGQPAHRPMQQPQQHHIIRR